ncbi:ADP-ribosylglycohydrolase [Seminavis robusta]|uniref:ADP-ribosylglycohydrolase n=1 Tax=Seminavis robusta TaxID=568900 RepID=A0A9N8E237_9STRA|nr:ADP-ribosylglycohydrolase [Seminavis robusta]|eukprot:Sro453_g145990.1 ADP-ribosylglycohydrolase (452) ;mRNA; f:5081-6436
MVGIQRVVRDKLKGSLYGMLVGDAVAVPVHWFYSPKNIRKEYGEITEIVASKPNHSESMLQGMSYQGDIDIMHNNAHFYEGNKLAQKAQEVKTKEEEQALRDDHGNFVGAKASDRVHYHRTLLKGQNTANACIARLAMRYLASSNAGGSDRYNPDEFLESLYNYMVTPPPKNTHDDKDQLVNHNDTYLDVYLRGFFTNASSGKALRDCAKNQRESWSIGSIDGVGMCIPMIVAYANEPEWYVMGRAVEHAHLTHKSITVTATLAILVPLLLELLRQPIPATSEEAANNLRQALDRAMLKMSPPKITGREMRDSYVNNRGPGNIPKAQKWKQHMELDTSETTKEFIHRMLEVENDEDVAGFGEREASRLSTACYCEQTFTVVLFLAYKYAHDPKKALLQNVMIGGHSTSRGMVLGAILGAAHGYEAIPFREDLCAKSSIEKEVTDLAATVVQ